MTQLSVNVDHIATLRQARGVDYPDPVEAARIAEASGASGITVHLRGDRRHIQDRDIVELRRHVNGKLNLEMAASEEMIAFAIDVGPDQVTLVPERPEELTTEGGLDLLRHGDRVRDAAHRLITAGIQVSLFLDPDRTQTEAAATLGQEGVDGFEINTDAYTRADSEAAARELAKIADVAAAGASAGLSVYAGHGLTVANVSPIAAISQIEELNIGHAIVSRAALVGMATAVTEMLEAMRQARNSAA